MASVRCLIVFRVSQLNLHNDTVESRTLNQRFPRCNSGGALEVQRRGSGLVQGGSRKTRCEVLDGLSPNLQCRFTFSYCIDNISRVASLDYTQWQVNPAPE